MNDKLRIQEALRVYGSEGVERDTLQQIFIFVQINIIFGETINKFLNVQD